MSEKLKKHWPAIPFAIGAVALGTGVALGALAIEGMVFELPIALALGGVSLTIVSAWLWYGMNTTEGDRGVMLAMGAILATLVIGLGYAGIHLGIAQVLQDFTFWESLGIQAGIGFGVGAAVGGGLALINSQNKANFVNAAVLSLCCAAATALGPLFTHIMETAVVNADAAVALEAMAAIAVASLIGLIVLGVEKKMDAI